MKGHAGLETGAPMKTNKAGLETGAPDASAKTVNAAYEKCLKVIEADNGELTSTMSSAGMIMDPGGKNGAQEGWQVFVKVIRAFGS